MPTESQLYLSTRGGSSNFSFRAAVLKGLAADGGLFIPHSIPQVTPHTLASWSALSFQDLALEILSLYISAEEIPCSELKALVDRSYGSFKAQEVTPLVGLPVERGMWLLELWHGPTYAFKDVALQFLGNLFEWFLVRGNVAKLGMERDHLTVLGATSGDTGRSTVPSFQQTNPSLSIFVFLFGGNLTWSSAAIYGLRGKKDVDVFILHPHKRISPIQEAQMCTVLDANVHNLAVNGTFDDCQDIVKQIFSDEKFNTQFHLGAVNSINWARILAQITYYFYSYFSLLRQQTTNQKPTSAGETLQVQYVVPTGNFGDILAGYYAKKMGLPIAKLVVATNENDILDRFFRGGRYEKNHEMGAKETLSPAMDILVSSNFERLLWYLAAECEATGSVEEKAQQAGKVVRKWMGDVKGRGGIIVSGAVLDAAKRDFSSYRVSDKETLETIAEVYDKVKYVLDPHTAVGINAALKLVRSQHQAGEERETICLSTAHPCKFSKAVNDALEGKEGYRWEDIIPAEVRDLLVGREQRVVYIPSVDVEAVKKVIVENVSR